MPKNSPAKLKAVKKEHGYSQDNRYAMPQTVMSSNMKEHKASQDGRSGKHADNMEAAKMDIPGKALAKF